ncbi:DUF1302 domain-containing protein [Solimicrobium silvestre]|uniref:DUF1302 domain-containing protein n=1 Tax=Solimicrobium silvestre TaxID=2099400 RepID=A0A2S9GTT7_9BURK|nr:DUF1302 domain-containing protein [Solimicrobium silvestre]PRC91147.1 hypothetical protein S2091_4148 [Solimicrobium silvestre]
MIDLGKSGKQRQLLRLKPRVMAQACSVALMALSVGGISYSSTAFADAFTLDNGDQGQWTADMSLGNTWRTMNANPALYSKPYGGTAGDGNQDGNLNYGKGDSVSTPFTISGELQLKHDTFGVVLGLKAWYDYTLEHKTVPIGSAANGFIANSKLNDSNYAPLSKFSGVAVNNAYLFNTFSTFDDKPLTIKLGDQVVNWGESLFIPGMNQFGAFNLGATHEPGATVKDILIPIPQVSANWGLGGGLSVEAFYQFVWIPNVAPGCGTFFSPSDVYNCGNATTPLLGDAIGNQYTQLTGSPLLHGINFGVSSLPEKDPKSSGQAGISSHYFASSISTDFGVYFARYNQRTPDLSISNTPSNNPLSIYSGNYTGKLGAKAGVANFLSPLTAYWDYSATDIQVAGLSAATEVGGWSLAGEVSYTKGLPVQINPADLVVGEQLGKLFGPLAGPLYKMGSSPSNSEIQGYDLHNKSQLQMNTTKVLSQVIGAESLTLVGEVGMQHWSGIGDPNDPASIRYGRAFLYGFATNNAAVCAKLNPNPAYCAANGFDTSSAWGYRMQAELSYPNALAGWNLKPRVFWSQDVRGTSGDGIFLQDRETLGLVLRADYLNKYYAQIAYTTYNHHAIYDPMNDRDNISAVIGIHF